MQGDGACTTLDEGETRPPGGWPGVGFEIAGVPCAAPFEALRAVVRCPVLTRMPGAAGWLLGSANLEGRLLAVVDLQGWLADAATPDPSREQVLILGAPAAPTGLLVRGVEALPACAPAPAPEASPAPWAPWLRGWIRAGDETGVRAWLDIAAIVARLEAGPDGSGGGGNGRGEAIGR